MQLAVHFRDAFGMSFSASDSLNIPLTGRKRTASQHVTKNGDPLTAKKKAREASKQQASASLSAQSIPAESAGLAVTMKKVPQVRSPSTRCSRHFTVFRLLLRW